MSRPMWWFAIGVALTIVFPPIIILWLIIGIVVFVYWLARFLWNNPDPLS